MDQQHIGIIWNPSKTTKEELETALFECVAALPTPPETINWYETTVEDPGQGATQQALEAGATTVFAVGGDGTVRAVAEQLAKVEADVDLGIIPRGTGNLLARNLGIPINDLSAAINQALKNDAQPVDIGWADVKLEEGTQRHGFVVMAGFGIDAHIISETDSNLKEKAGWIAYFEAFGRAVLASKVLNLRVNTEGKTPIKIRAHTVIIGNCGSLQNNIKLLPDADPTDGELDLLLLRAKGVLGWIDSVRNMIWDNGFKRILNRGTTARSSQSTIHSRFTTLHVALEEPRIFQLDGDELGKTTQLDISVQPGALKIR